MSWPPPMFCGINLPQNRHCKVNMELISYLETDALLQEPVQISRAILAANDDFPKGEIHVAINAYN